MKKLINLLITVFAILGIFVVPNIEAGFGFTFMYVVAYFAAIVYLFRRQRNKENNEIKKLRKEGYNV